MSVEALVGRPVHTLSSVIERVEDAGGLLRLESGTGDELPHIYTQPGHDLELSSSEMCSNRLNLLKPSWTGLKFGLKSRQPPEHLSVFLREDGSDARIEGLTARLQKAVARWDAADALVLTVFQLKRGASNASHPTKSIESRSQVWPPARELPDIAVNEGDADAQ